jgi:hypothetical protein
LYLFLADSSNLCVVDLHFRQLEIRIFTTKKPPAKTDITIIDCSSVPDDRKCPIRIILVSPFLMGCSCAASAKKLERKERILGGFFSHKQTKKAFCLWKSNLNSGPYCSKSVCSIKDRERGSHPNVSIGVKGKG